MKIGILGLRPRQFADIAGRKFNGHEVFNYEAKSYNQESVAGFCRKMDKVLIIRSGVPASAIEYVVFTKRHVMNGSVSTITRYLDTIPCDTPMDKLKPLLVQPKKALTNEELVRQATQQTAPKELTSIIPTGYESQYKWYAHATTIKPSEKGHLNYELLDAAQPGDVLRLTRPADLELSVWKTRIYSLRYNREKKQKQLLEAHFYPHYVDLLVMFPKTEEVKQEVAETAEEPASTIEVAQLPSSFTVEDGAVIDTPSEKVTHEAEPDVTQEPIPYQEAPTQSVIDPSLVPAPKEFTPAERGLWRQAMLAAMHSGNRATSAALEADEAVQEYRKRFVTVRKKK